MNGKTIIKRTLPIIIGLAVIVVIALVAVFATRAKKTPSFKDVDGNASYVSYTLADGTEIKVTNKMVYDTLTGSSTAISATVSEMVDIIDSDLLKENIQNVKAEDVYDRVATSLFGDEFKDYLEDNEEKFKLQAKKDGISYFDYTEKQIKEKITDFVKTLNLSYGINASEEDFEYLDGNGDFAFSVKATSDTYAYFVIAQARYDYARVKMEEQYKDALAAYLFYEECEEAYTKYQDAYEDYEDALADWKNADKSSRGEKPVAPDKKDYYVTKEGFDTYKLDKEPEAVDAPAIKESDVKSLYDDEYYDTYYTFLIPYATKTAAEEALLQNGIVIATNKSGDTTWFHYGVTDYTGDADTKADLEEKYGVKGKTTVLIDNDYYKTVDGVDANTGAYELSEKEIKEAIVTLYNQFYQAHDDKVLVLDTDYTVSADGLTYTLTESGKEKVEYTQEDLTNLGLFSTASTNKFNKFKAEGENSFRDSYTYTILSGSSIYSIYLILGKNDTLSFDEYLEDLDKEYYETDFYNEKLAELLDKKTTTTFINKTVAALRVDAGLLIYDEKIEESYMSTYTSDYKATKKSNNHNVCSYNVGGEKKYVSVDDLYVVISAKYGAVSAIDKYQYEWMLLEAKDNEGNLVNKYVDYQAYKKGKKIDKCILKNDDAKELYETVETYVENTKNNFSAGNYESSGYPASFGWNNFLNAYFLENYGIKVSSTDDLKLFYIYQRVVNDYCEEIAKINEDLYTTVFYTYMAKTLARELNTTGVHFLISVKDLDGNMVDPANWTATQVEKAKELYDEVLTLVQMVPSDDLSTVLNELVSAFDSTPLLLNGLEPNINYVVKTISGDEYNYKYLNYNYVYYPKGSDATASYTIDVSEYKSAGLSVTSESLSVTDGAMVSEFESAVREIWNKQLTTLFDGETLNEAVVYDHTYSPVKYDSYDEDGNVVATNGTYLATQYGYHVYVNLTSTLGSYFVTDKADNKVFVGFPSYTHVQMYLYELTQNSKDDYVSFADLYEDYTDAVEDNLEAVISKAKEKLLDKVNSLGFNYTWDQFEGIIKEYADDDYKAYTKNQLTKWFTSNSSSSYTLAYSDYVSSSYYQLAVMKVIAENYNNFTYANNEDKAKFEEAVNYYIDNYEGALVNTSFTKKDKDAVKELLEAMACLKDFAVYGDNADKLLTDSEKCDYTEVKTRITDVFNALKTYASDAYNALNAEDKAELADLAEKAGLIS